MHCTSFVCETRHLRGSASAAVFAATVLAAPVFNGAPTLAASFVTAAVKVSPAVDHPSASIKVSGTGFAANEAVDVYFDTTDELLAVTNGSGAFGRYPMRVPSDALPGTHWITAVGRKGGAAAQKVFTVRTDWPEIGFSPKGRRSNPYENVLTPETVSSLDVGWAATTGQYVNASPAVANGNVYVTSNDHNLYAFNATTGAKLWSATLGDYSNSSPTVADAAIYVGANDGKLYAFNVKTGAPLWTATTGAQIESSPAVANGVVYVGSDDHNLYAFSAASGASVWTVGLPDKITTSPAVANGAVYIDTASDLFAYDAATGGQLMHDGGTPFNASPAVANGVLYVGHNNGYLIAVDAANGNGLWSQSTGGTTTSPAVANGTVYVGSTNGSLYAFNAANGAAQWSASLGDAVTSSPAVAGGVVYAAANLNGSENELYALDASSGAALWAVPMGSGMQSSPAVANGMVYVGSDDYNLYAFALDGGRHAPYRKNVKPPAPSALQPDWRLKPVCDANEPRGR